MNSSCADIQLFSSYKWPVCFPSLVWIKFDEFINYTANKFWFDILLWTVKNIKMGEL